MKKLAEAVKILICILDMPSSNLGQDTTTLTEVSRGIFSYSRQANARVVP
jgi:hypothetical protein